MKKIPLLVLLLIMASAGCFAQQGFHLGLTGNLNTVWIVNQDAYGLKEYAYKLDIGGGAGVQAGYNITNHIGFLAEIKTSQEGQKYQENDVASVTRQAQLDYLAIPVLFKFIGGAPSSGVKFYADGGIQFNFLTKATLIDYYGSNVNTDAKPRYNSSDNGINFGLGADISLTKYLYLNAGMSFFYSFSDINAAVGSGPGSFENKTWQWPDKGGAGIYAPSRNATGGLSVGIHYLFAK